MKYIKLMLDVPNDRAEIVLSELADMGVESTELKSDEILKEILDNKDLYKWDYVGDSLIYSGNNETVEIDAYLRDDENGRKTALKIEDAFMDLDVERVRVDEEDWVNSYKDDFKSMDLTDSLIVKPSWETIDGDTKKKIIELDPGMAFGTGSHGTTSMCAKFMDEVGCENKKVLDVGTGSGLLAIAGAALGAEDVLAVDIDSDAVEIAKSNVDVNNFGEKVTVKYGDLTEGIDYKADIVVANLFAELLCTLTAHVKEHLNEGGFYITSGILDEKLDMVVKAIEDTGMEVVKVAEEGEWRAILAR